MKPHKRMGLRQLPGLVNTGGLGRGGHFERAQRSKPLPAAPPAHPFHLQFLSCGLALRGPKSPFSFFHKIRHIFNFTSNFIDLDIWSTSVISHYWILVGRGRGAAKHLPTRKAAPQQRIILPKCQ